MLTLLRQKKQKGNDSMSDRWKKYQKNQDEEDDGRTVADMSDVQRSTFLGGWRPIGMAMLYRKSQISRRKIRVLNAVRGRMIL